MCSVAQSYTHLFVLFRRAPGFSFLHFTVRGAAFGDMELQAGGQGSAPNAYPLDSISLGWVISLRNSGFEMIYFEPKSGGRIPKTMDIRDHTSAAIGTMEFVKEPDSLSSERTIDGFKIFLPFTLTLPRIHQDRSLLISNLRGIVYTSLRSQAGIELGRLVSDTTYYAAPWTKDTPCTLRWSASMGALVRYEEIRANGPVEFQVELFMDILEERSGVLAAPTAPIFGRERISYSAELWARLLTNLRIVETIMLEIPFACQSPKGWERVWSEISNARAALQKSGEAARRECGLAVRLAFEEWKKIEPERIDATKRLRDRSKQERLDALRQDLKNFADLSVHTAVEDWSREEVLLMLTALCALIKLRDP